MRSLLSKRNLAIIFGGALVITVAIVAVAVGVGHPDVPDDDVAVIDDDRINVTGVVEDGVISKESFDELLQQTATQQGLQEVPQPSDPQYGTLKEQALTAALDIAWIAGEGERQAVEVTDTEIQQSFEQTKNENFQTEKEYQQFLTEQGLTQEDVLERVRLQAISSKIEEELTENVSEPSESEASDFYDANKEQFAQPEQRTIRLIQNSDAAKIQQAFDQLSADNSPANWKKVAAELSTDPTSKEKGGVRENVVPGSFEQPLDDEIFDAPEGEVQGPTETPTASYVFQVDSITPETTQSFDQVRDQIVQQINSTKEQEIFAAFLSSYQSYWSSITFCGEDYLIDRCDNFTGEAQPCPDPNLPEAQQQQQLTQQGCPPPAPTISPVAPGSIELFTPASGGQPQKPHPPGEDTAAPAAPGGVPGGGIVPTG